MANLFEIRTDLASVSTKDWARKHGALRPDGTVDMAKYATLSGRPGQYYKFPVPTKEWTPKELAEQLDAYKRACITRADEIEKALVTKYKSENVPSVKFGEMFSDAAFARNGVSGPLNQFRGWVVKILKNANGIQDASTKGKGVLANEAEAA